MAKIQKETILAIIAVSVAVALIAMIAYPAYAAEAEADYEYALNQESWVITEEYTDNTAATFADLHTMSVNAKGFAFLRIDEETLKQYNCETNLVIQIQPATETTQRETDITGYVKINDATYTISSGKAVLRKEKKILFLKCEGLDESGNQITLKLSARYFWWGGKAYAFRSTAVLQTVEKPMLLLQRGIARIQ